MIIILGILSAVSFTCSSSIHHDMMDLISSRPVKEQFKLWHYVMQKPYDLESAEAKSSYRNFKNNLKKYEEINSKNLGFTVGLGPFSDIDFSKEENLSIITGGNEDVNVQTKIDFDLMADNDDDEITPDTLNDEGKDWSELFKTSYPLVEFTGSREFIVFCQNHTYEQGFAHVINAHAKINDVYKGNASSQFYRNCNENGKEDCRTTIAFQKYFLYESIPLEKDLPWTNNVGNCVNPPTSEVYGAKWLYCGPYSAVKCSDQVLNGYIQQGPYLSKISNIFEILNYKSGIVPTENCYSSSIAVIVVKIEPKSIKALLPFGPKVGKDGYVFIKNETIAHPEISCGLKSYAMVPDVYVDN